MKRFIVYGLFFFFGILLIAELYFRLFGNYCESYFDKHSKIVKRKRNTEGVYKTKYTHTGYFRINNVGWNSHRDYYCVSEQEKTEKLRIAIVGHSNIEGLRVLVNETLSKVLEDDLNEKGIPAEVYTFGYGGLHLAQALHLSRYVVKTFQPDILIIGTMLDDFWINSASNKNFLNLDINRENIIQEVIPEKFVYTEKSVFSFLYFSKCIQYTDKRTGIGAKLYNILNKPSNDNNGFDSSKTETIPTRLRAYKYLINEFRKISDTKPNHKIPVFFINFPMVVPSYNYDFNEVQISSNLNINDQLSDIIRENMFEIIDMDKSFSDDYSVNLQKFDFKNDYHYNAHAHLVMGKKLSEHIQAYLIQTTN